VDEAGGEVPGEGEPLGLVQLPAGAGDLAAGALGGGSDMVGLLKGMGVPTVILLREAFCLEPFTDKSLMAYVSVIRACHAAAEPWHAPRHRLAL
jgi:hypothetical protein